MINLLRRIRRNTMTEKKSDLYLVYAIGEVVLVVLGILIALQIDNWNENKKARSIEQQYLQALKEEFEFNKDELAKVIDRNRLNGDNMLILVNHIGPADPDLNEEELGDLLRGSLSQEIQFNPSQGVLDEIISSGKLGMFSSQELRFALSSWSGKMYKVRLQEQELLRIRYITIDIIRNEGNLRKALGSFLEQIGIEQTKFQKGNLDLLKSISFEGHMMGAVTMSLNLNNYQYSMLDREMDNILSFIEAGIIEN